MAVVVVAAECRISVALTFVSPLPTTPTAFAVDVDFAAILLLFNPRSAQPRSMRLHKAKRHSYRDRLVSVIRRQDYIKQGEGT